MSGVVAACTGEVMTSNMSDVEEQSAEGDVLKCLSPLLGSMRLVGHYFTRTSRPFPDASGSTAATPDSWSAASRKWNGGRIYSAVVCVLIWLNAGRMLTAFDENDNKFGYAVLMKLSVVSGEFVSAVMQTACFVACQTGNLDRVFADARLPKSRCVGYRRWAVVLAVMCWTVLSVEMVVFMVPVFFTEKLLSLSMAPFGVHVAASGLQILLIKLFATLMSFFVYSSFVFPMSVNHMDCSKVLP